VSVDSISDQKAFAENYAVPYPMLCDTDKSITRSYGILRGSMAGRASFLIDKNGIVRKVWSSVTPAVHAREVIASLKSLRSP
jgi:peroxiredoxin Q/BCP